MASSILSHHFITNFLWTHHLSSCLHKPSGPAWIKRHSCQLKKSQQFRGYLPETGNKGQPNNVLHNQSVFSIGLQTFLRGRWDVFPVPAYPMARSLAFTWGNIDSIGKGKTLYSYRALEYMSWKRFWRPFRHSYTFTLYMRKRSSRGFTWLPENPLSKLKTCFRVLSSQTEHLLLPPCPYVCEHKPKHVHPTFFLTS